MNVLWESPLPSQEICVGPEVSLVPGSVMISMAFEDGELHRLRFEEVAKFMFTEFRACSPDHLGAYDKLLDLGTDTPFAQDALASAHQDMSALRHFRLFVDDVGTYDVFALSCRLDCA